MAVFKSSAMENTDTISTSRRRRRIKEKQGGDSIIARPLPSFFSFPNDYQFRVLKTFFDSKHVAFCLLILERKGKR